MNDAPFAPDQVEDSIREVSNNIGRGVNICAAKYREYLTANADYERIWHEAYLAAADKPAHTRKSIAELATMARRHADPDGLSARDRRDVADAAYRLVDRQARALELELRALQSVGASVRAMYQVAGRGEW